MTQDGILVKNRIWLWLPLALYAVVCFVVPCFFFTSWPLWVAEVVGMLSVGGERLLRSMARSVYKKLKMLLPEHAQEIQAYRDDLNFFKRNIMIQPDFVAPLAADYPKKDELMAELRMRDKISRIWNSAGTVLLLLGIAYMFVSFMF